MVKSILTDDMEHCFRCGTSQNIQIHHCIHGTSNRKNSDKYGLIVPLCIYHHTGSNDAVHLNADFDRRLKAYAQTKFEEMYPELSFKEIFGKNFYF